MDYWLISLVFSVIIVMGVFLWLEYRIYLKNKVAWFWPTKIGQNLILMLKLSQKDLLHQRYIDSR